MYGKIIGFRRHTIPFFDMISFFYLLWFYAWRRLRFLSHTIGRFLRSIGGCSVWNGSITWRYCLPVWKRSLATIYLIISVTFSSCFSVRDQRPLVLDERETVCTLSSLPIRANGTKRTFSRVLFFFFLVSTIAHLLPAVSLLDCWRLFVVDDCNFL